MAWQRSALSECFSSDVCGQDHILCDGCCGAQCSGRRGDTLYNEAALCLHFAAWCLS